MISGLHICNRLVDTFETLGATTPESILETLAIGRTIKKIATSQAGTDVDSIINRGTNESVTEALTQYAQERALREAIGERYGQWELALTRRFVADLLSEAGESMFESLRPAFDTAAKAVTHSLEYFGPDTGPDQVVEMDPKALAVWQGLRAHANTLETIYGLCHEIALCYDALPSVTHLRNDAPPLAFVIAEPTRSLNEITSAFKAPRGRNPAGHWARLATVAQLELRTPAQARATVQRLEDELAQQLQDDVANNHRELKEVS